MKVLIVEDDLAIVRLLQEYLASEGHEACACRGYQDAQVRLERDSFDLVLVDLSLLDGDGFEVCALARKNELPVIFLTASSDENDVVKGLDMGGDDYVTKPFRPRELLSRMRTVIRRNKTQDPLVHLGNVAVNVDSGKVYKDGLEIALSALEFRLLAIFAQAKGKLVGRNRLMEDIYDISGDYVNDNTLTVYVKRLREKIEDDPSKPRIIQTVRGIGYRVIGDD